MNERLRQAIEGIVAVAQEASGLARKDQEELAVRLEIMAKELSWQQLFYSSEPIPDARIDATAPLDTGGEAHTFS
jgi:hypothetical protein